jgi:hypothetical protein
VVVILLSAAAWMWPVMLSPDPLPLPQQSSVAAQILPAKPRYASINVMALSVRLSLVSASDLADGMSSYRRSQEFTCSGHVTTSTVFPVLILSVEWPSSAMCRLPFNLQPICRCGGPSSASSWRLPATPSQVVRPRRRSCWPRCGARLYCAVETD